MDYKIREIKESEHSVLSDFLYEAIFIPKGMENRQNLLLNSQSCKYILRVLEKRTIGVSLWK